jgi:hypothetical protein
MSVIPKIVEQSDVVPVALEFCKDMLQQENIEGIVQYNIGWLPNYETLLNEEALDFWSLSASDRDWLEGLFHYTFVYYKKYKMLCVIGDYTGYKQIIFQNSCDQDENFKTWEALYAADPCRDIFKELVDKTVSGENIADIHEYFTDTEWGEDTDEDIDEEYYKRWYVYKKIENSLCIGDVLWDVDSDDFFKFEFGKRLTVSNMTTIRAAAVKALNKEIERLKNFRDNMKKDSIK